MCKLFQHRDPDARVSAALSASLTAASVDFHGLRKAEAMDALRTRLAELSGAKGVLELVPGAGKHSGGGGAVLMPAVVAALKEKGLKFEEKTAGSLIVQLA